MENNKQINFYEELYGVLTEYNRHFREIDDLRSEYMTFENALNKVLLSNTHKELNENYMDYLRKVSEINLRFITLGNIYLKSKYSQLNSKKP